MTSQDLPAFNRAFNSLAEVYNLKDHEERRAQYYRALDDLAISALEAAFTKAIRNAGVGNCRFFPLPGVLREMASAFSRASTTAPSCAKCNGTGLVPAQPDMDLVRQLYGQDATADAAQPTSSRCDCRAVA